MTPVLRPIGIDQIVPDPNQPRLTFAPEELERLATSIKARGMLQPIRVTWDVSRKTWRLITGECRWRAARLAGLAEVPCLLIEGEPSELDLLLDQLVENAVRHSLTPTDEARALVRAKELKGCTAQQLAAELGISGSAITRAEALLSLPESIQAMVDDGRLAGSAAYDISRLPDESGQLGLAEQIRTEGLNRDQVTEIVRQRVGKRAMSAKAAGRLACKLEEGVSITVTAAKPLTREMLRAAAARLSQEAKKLVSAGLDAAEQAPAC